MTNPKTVLVVSTEQALSFPAGSHKSLPEPLLLPAGVHTPVPVAALPFVLNFPGVERVSPAGPSEPSTPEE